MLVVATTLGEGLPDPALNRDASNGPSLIILGKSRVGRTE